MNACLWALYILIDVGYIVIIVFLINGICEMRRERKEMERDIVKFEIERRKRGRDEGT